MSSKDKTNSCRMAGERTLRYGFAFCSGPSPLRGYFLQVLLSWGFHFRFVPLIMLLVMQVSIELSILLYHLRSGVRPGIWSWAPFCC